jgi:hypothetical protein
MKAEKFIYGLAPIDWEETVDGMSTSERSETCKELESIARQAAMCAGYIDMRHGHGCGDQGHNAAMKEANRIGKIIWMKAFGYNAFRNIVI